MALRVVVIGGGAGGLAAALALGRAGHEVILLERDQAPSSQDPDEAFASWDRPGVAHVRQGHLILARAMSVLRAHAPDVLTGLAARGAPVLASQISALFPPEVVEPGDDDLGLLPCRRIPFELALRRAAVAES